MAAVEPGSSPEVLVETSHDLPLISVSVGSSSGSLLDPEGREGLTRLTGRLMRRTAGGKNPQEIDTIIDSLGGALSVEVSPSATVFQGTVIRRSLEPFLALVSDVLARPGLAEDELGRLERETEAELMETLDDDRSLARRWFRKALFDGHGYGRPVSGTSESLRRVTQRDVQERAKRLATRTGLLFAFSGDIERDEAEALSARVASALVDAPREAVDVADPVMKPKRRLVLVDKPERTQTQILIGGQGTHPRDPDHTALMVGNTIFGGTFTARMTQEVRSKRGWSYGAYSSLPVDRRRQAFSMWTFPKAEDAGPCIALQLEMLHDLRERGVTKKELSWAKRYLSRSHAFAIDTPAKRVGLQLDSKLYDLPAGYYERYLERVAATTLDEVNQALRARLPEEDLLVVVVGTAADIRTSVENAIPELAETEVVRFDLEV
ncbi:MAG TPA: pitrilysin family protein [Polyangiaceae bacterium]|nr:pitrilysin family protein [Polyangiaceae bacterium]